MKKYNIKVIFLFISMCLSAQQWTITTKSASVVEGTREDGKKVSIVSSSNISKDVIKKITNCLDTVWSINGLKGVASTVNVEDNSKFRFVIHPTSLKYGEEELVVYLPSGMAFFYDNALFYDTVVKVGDVLPKITGAYISAKDYVEEIKNASVFPDLYLYDTYILARIEKVEKALMALSKKGIFSKPSEVSPEVVLAVRSLYNSNPDITQKEILSELKSQGISASAGDIAAVYMVYLGIIE